MQQMAQCSKRDSWRDESLILADPGQPSPFTVTPVIPQPPLTPVSTPPLMPTTQPPASSRVTPRAFTSPIQQPTPGLTPNVLPPTMPVPYPIHPARRSNTGCVVTAIVSIALVGALVLGSVFFLPKIFSIIQGNGFTGPLQPTVPGISSTQGVNPPLGQSSQPDTAGASSTIKSFCFDLEANAIQNAYDLTSTNYQNQHSIDAFNTQFSNVDISGGGGCLAGNPTVGNNTVVVPLTIHYSQGFQKSTSHYTATLIQANNAWVIDSIV